jgi:hypothetical protein
MFWYGPPGNVMTFFRLQDCEGRAVPGLRSSDFHLKDDGQLMPMTTVRGSLGNPGVGIRLFTLLLVDYSVILASQESRGKVLAAAGQLVTQLVNGGGHPQEVAIYFFDGTTTPGMLHDFTSDAVALTGALDSLMEEHCQSNADCTAFQPYCVLNRCTDTSTNLHGAIIQGLWVLDEKTASVDPTMVRSGHLVIVTDGTDQTHLPDFYEKAQDAVDGSVHNVYAIGLGPDVDPAEIAALGKRGSALPQDLDSVDDAFASIQQSVQSDANSNYIFGFCSPRKGASQHTAEVFVPGSSGSHVFTYDSTEFGSGACESAQIADPCANMECENSYWLNCGECAGCGDACQDGTCLFQGCVGLECGSDGCGGSCGTCPVTDHCLSGKCHPLTWKDPLWGHTWQISPMEGESDWTSAKTYCQQLNLAGQTGWRLPTIDELRDLIRGCAATERHGSCNVGKNKCTDFSCSHDSCWGCQLAQGPGADGFYWPDEVQGDCCHYWSTTDSSADPDSHWVVGFHTGEVFLHKNTTASKVRCVK